MENPPEDSDSEDTDNVQCWGTEEVFTGKIDVSKPTDLGPDGSRRYYAFPFDFIRGHEKFVPDDAYLHLWETQVSAHEEQFLGTIRAWITRAAQKHYYEVAESDPLEAVLCSPCPCACNCALSDCLQVELQYKYEAQKKADSIMKPRTDRATKVARNAGAGSLSTFTLPRTPWFSFKKWLQRATVNEVMPVKDTYTPSDMKKGGHKMRKVSPSEKYTVVLWSTARAQAPHYYMV